MQISIVGSGYVGTTMAACLADIGHTVTNIDTNETIIEQINAGKSPIHEPGVAEHIENHSQQRLYATTDYDAVCDTDVTFVALPTPTQSDGRIDTSMIERGIRSLGNVLTEKTNPHLIVIKSTVVPGTTEGTLAPLLEEITEKSLEDELTIATNPEFLREGTAVTDFLDRINSCLVLQTNEQPRFFTLCTLLFVNDPIHLSWRPVSVRQR